jgi:hypothetical protein
MLVDRPGPRDRRIATTQHADLLLCKHACTLRGPIGRITTGSSAVLVAALACCVGAFAAGRPPAAAGAPCPGSGLRPTATNAPAVDAAKLCLIDHVRAAHRLAPLRANRELDAVAASQVGAMMRWDYFADVRPSGQTPLSLVVVTPYPAHGASISIAQNIAWGTGADTTPAHIVAAWMASGSHRAIILTGEYRDAGVGVRATLPRVVGAGGRGATYVMEFGARHA